VENIGVRVLSDLGGGGGKIHAIPECEVVEIQPRSQGFSLEKPWERGWLKSGYKPTHIARKTNSFTIYCVEGNFFVGV